jgi:peptidoglycan/xylan/chitin deacetylase (PgdA/CDA1 family)
MQTAAPLFSARYHTVSSGTPDAPHLGKPFRYNLIMHREDYGSRSARRKALPPPLDVQLVDERPIRTARMRPAAGRRWIRWTACVLLAAACSACGESSAPTGALTPTPSDTRSAPSVTPSPRATDTPSPTASPTREPAAERIPAVEYHHSTFRLADDVMMQTDWFRDQMAWLAENGYRTLTAEQLASFLDGAYTPAKSVVLTFDIGTAQRADYLENILPTLRQHGFHAQFFVLVNAISDECGFQNQVCWQDLRDWHEEGLISVESHGMYHPDYTTLSADQQRWDAETARQIIADQIGEPPIGFAFPFDAYNETAQHIVESVGYSFALAGNTGKDRSIHRLDPNRFSLPRVYPYSNPEIYPVVYAAYGKTFGELIVENSEAADAAPPEPGTATLTPTERSTADDAEAYYRSCLSIDGVADPVERLYALSQLFLPESLAESTASQLALPVVLKPSCNIALGNVPRGIVLHITRGTLTASISEFQRPQSTSAHYIIDRDGQIYQLVPESLGAYHASCGGIRSVCIPTCPLCEDAQGAFREPYLQSIGIELVNDGQLPDPETYGGLIYEDYLMAFGYRYWEDFPEQQLQALRLLVNDIRARYGIPLDLVVGHYRINSKTDPGPALNISWTRSGNPPRPPIFTE